MSSDRDRKICNSAHSNQSGVALLAVLWLSVALTMIAMTTAYLVRTEAIAVGNHIESGRAALLAHAGVEAAVYAILHPAIDPSAPADEPSLNTRIDQQFRPGQRWLRFDFGTGVADVEVVPENAKLSVNQAPPAQLSALFTNLGLTENQSQELAAAIVDWRTPRASSVATPFDFFYVNLPQPYEARHAAMEELDELLAVKGMSHDLFFGALSETPEGASRWAPPLADLLTTEPALWGINVMYAPYEVLLVLPGWDETLARAVVDARKRIERGTLAEAVPGLSSAMSLYPVTFTSGAAYTLTATAEMRDSGVRHSVRARILLDRTVPLGFRVAGWWEAWPWSNETAAAADRMGGARI